MKSKEQIETFAKVTKQMESMLAEFDALSSKKPNDGINSFKLNLVNAILKTLNTIVGPEDRPFKDFSEFSEEALPSNSDVKLILSQYRTCLVRFFAENVIYVESKGNLWIIGGKISEVRAPSEFRYLAR